MRIGGTVLRFAGFELDLDRVELRGVGGEAIKLRPKTFALLQLFATNPNRLLTKQELMSAIWPNIHVGDDSLFQCIREIRAALGDEKRQLVKSVSGRGYLFEGQVFDGQILEGQALEGQDLEGHLETSTVSTAAEPSSQPVTELQNSAAGRPPAARTGWRWLSAVQRPAIAASVAVCFAIGVAVAAPILMRHLSVPELPTIAVMPIEAETTDRATAAMATNVTDRLTDGLSKIGNIRVIAPQSTGNAPVQTFASAPRADFVLRGDLQRRPAKWEIRARLIDGNGQVQWSTEYSVPAENLDEALQQSRLTAGVGYPLALQINSLAHARLPSADSKIVVEQAAAFINQTSRERFAAAQAMLEKALAAKPDDVHLEAALAAHLLRGIQLVWYPSDEIESVEKRSRSLLEKALKQEPNYIPALQGYCRLLTATNYFADSLIACEKALTLQPWDGSVLYQIGLSQLQLGRFEDALASFLRADTYDTPQVSRWVWLLGVGLTLVNLERHEEAVQWLQRSLAITPGTGRTHLILAAAYEALGRHEEAKAAIANTLQLRPGSNIGNVGLPTKNQGARYTARVADVRKLLLAAGLPAQ